MDDFPLEFKAQGKGQSMFGACDRDEPSTQRRCSRNANEKRLPPMADFTKTMLKVNKNRPRIVNFMMRPRMMHPESTQIL
jgi:hypothetical protein